MDILPYPTPALTDTARPIEAIDDHVRSVAAEMLDTMYRARGIGLAGPQVGYPYRLITLNLTGQPEDARVFVNPELLASEGDEVADEGCLSFPGLHARVHRAVSVRVGALDLEGQPVEVRAEGLLARAFQHEIDHLEGILLVSRLLPAERTRHSGFLKELERRLAPERRRASSLPARPGVPRRR
ncbi:MAG: peptide deformylase [Planctomycetes bacterium]|nr:peptide deformylase [Planctomycetota bacterium]